MVNLSKLKTLSKILFKISLITKRDNFSGGNNIKNSLKLFVLFFKVELLSLLSAVKKFSEYSNCSL